MRTAARAATRPWKAIFTGTLEQWIKEKRLGLGDTIREEHGIIAGSDVSYRRIAVDKNGKMVAVEYETLESTVCIVYVPEWVV